MADIVSAVVAHLRADSTLTTLLAASGGNTRINIEYNTELSPELPQIYVSELPGGEDIAASAGLTRVALWTEASSRALCKSLHDRIRQLLHMKSNVTIGASPNTIACSRVMRGGPAVIERGEANAAYEGSAIYEFVHSEPHGF